MSISKGSRIVAIRPNPLRAQLPAPLRRTRRLLATKGPHGSIHRCEVGERVDSGYFDANAQDEYYSGAGWVVRRIIRLGALGSFEATVKVSDSTSGLRP